MKIAFYAPIKPPDHPIPSGDRLIAANTVEALRLAGHEVVLASRFIAYAKRHEPGLLEARRAAAIAEAEAAMRRLRQDPPHLVLTYHPYCKAPDWIGPRLAAALGVPYVTLEAARTGQGGEADPWADWRAEAQAGFGAADLHVCLKPNDRAMLRAVLGPDAPVADLAPFIDVPPPPPPRSRAPGEPVRLVTVAMMRPGKKVANFVLLADALSRARLRDWTLTIVGGGPAEESVRAAFAPLGERVGYLGELEREGVLRVMSSADLFVWPGLAEPIGMVFLEAQAMGLPVAASADMGVPLVVADGVTGVLAAEPSPHALAGAIDRLAADGALRGRLAAAARGHVEEHHSLRAASARLDALLKPLVAR